MKALIVDDESRVRKAIRLLVHWEEHGITDIQEASNGLEAMELIDSEHPSIVLMDMLMPLKSGIDLMEWIHTHAPETKFLVISGHDDFEFVRNTVWYNGVDYILKPIEEDIVNAAVAKAVTTWKSEEQERRIASQQKVQVNEYRPVYAEKLFTSLIEDSSSHQQVVRRLKEEHAIPDGLQTIRLAVLQIDTTDKDLYGRFGNHVDLLLFAMLNICNELLSRNRTGTAFRHLGYQNIIILLIWDTRELLVTLLSEINQGIYSIVERYMHFGISPTGQFPADLPELYSAGLHSIRNRDLLRLNHFIHESNQVNIEACQPVLFREVEDKWKLAILSAQPKLIEEAVAQWIALVRKQGIITPEQLERWNRDIERFQIRIIHEYAGPATNKLLSQLHEQQELIQQPNPDKYILSLSEWQQYWQEALNRLAQDLLSLKLSGQDLIHDITMYIEQNYKEDISLYDIADRFHVSREYVSRKFKQKHQINIPEYVNRLRISKAKPLLQNPNLKIAMIAEMVGFKNEKYFSLIFKKQEGLSPKEFRKLHEV